MNEKLLNKIICTAYGDASIIDKLHVRLLALKNKEINALLLEYKKSAQLVHRMPEESVSDSVIRRVYSNLNLNNESNFVLKAKTFSFFYRRPIAASAALVVVSIIIAISVFIYNPVHKTEYKPEEIERAAVQANEVFKFVNNTFTNAGRTVKEDVIEKNVNKPINEKLNTISKIITKGEVK